eukprot:SAG31_NODE_45833_length_257_cov_0.651899_1_plen_53_part_10
MLDWAVAVPNSSPTAAHRFTAAHNATAVTAATASLMESAIKCHARTLEPRSGK